MAKRRGRKKQSMSKKIRFTEQEIVELQREFYEHLMKAKMLDGNITFSKKMASDKVGKRATVEFSTKAFAKMIRLIADFSTEVAWHGTARRDENDPAKFYIDDILVYPQTVTGGTVNTDQAKYETWLYKLEDDQFNNLRMQGHSHVNFQTFASGTDLEHQRKIIDQLEDGMFYIFMIWNKRLERNVMIYDYANNVYYENSDVDIPGMEFSFLTDARKQVETVYSKSQWSGGSGGATSVGSPYNPVKSTTPATTSTAKAPATTAPAKPEEKKPATTTEKKIEVVSANAPVKTEEPKSEEPKSKPKATVMGAGWRGRVAAYDDEDDDDTCFGTLLHRIATM